MYSEEDLLPISALQHSRPVRARGLKRILYAGDGDAQVVAPRAGAWIETIPSWPARARATSRPARARGLKLSRRRVSHRHDASRPVRARGLKQCAGDARRDVPASRPVRARGLKHVTTCITSGPAYVAPRAGAWIETGE